MERGFSGLNNRTLLKFNVFGRGDSIRRRSLDLLYGMCDISNAKDIVEELLQVSHLFLLEIQLVMHLQWDYLKGELHYLFAFFLYWLFPRPILQYLTTADFGIREELALKAAILAEKFAPNLAWYDCFLLHRVSEYLFTVEIEAKLLCQLDSVLRTARTSISNVFLRASMQ